MDEKILLHALVDSPWLAVGFLFIAYLIREQFKDKKYDRIREEQNKEWSCRFMLKGEQDLAKFECQFASEDHARISDTLLMSKTNEIFIKEIANDQSRLVSSLERVTDKVENIARELRKETDVLKKALYKKGQV